MPRSITINGVQFLDDAKTPFNGTTGTISAAYVAVSVDANNAITQYPDATIYGAASVGLTATDTAAAKLPALCGLMLSQEGLTQGTDHVYGKDGGLLA